MIYAELPALVEVGAPTSLSPIDAQMGVGVKDLERRKSGPFIQILLIVSLRVYEG